MIVDGDSRGVARENETSRRPEDGDGALPTPKVRRRRWTGVLIWLVPLAALAAFIFYAQKYSSQRGPEVVVRMADAPMLTEGETPVRCRGVEIGRVAKVALAGDQSGADVTLRLHRDAGSFAREGATYWLVTPDLRGGSLRGLNTVLSGPYLEARSGGGEPRGNFVGLAAAPAASAKGLTIRLLAAEMKRVDRGTPIQFRGIQVGAVDSAVLAKDATHVILSATIEPRFAALVRANSRFWSEPPAEIKGGIFSGVEVELGSIQQLLSGSIHFASPDKPLERPAMGDDRFVLHEEPAEEWKKWTPEIDIDANAPPSGSETPSPPQTSPSR